MLHLYKIIILCKYYTILYFIRFTLIHNLNYYGAFPIDQDGYLSPTFQDILVRTHSGSPLPWHISLHKYYFRPEWQLFDRKEDPQERNNVAYKPRYSRVMEKMKEQLYNWQNLTNDPWLCSPHAVLERQAGRTVCMELFN